MTPSTVTLREIEEAHHKLLPRLRRALQPTCTPTSGVWDRLSAARFLTQEFAPAFRADRDAVARSDQVAPPDADCLWALAELLDFQQASLANLARMPQGGCAFAELVGKFERAYEAWCAEVEAVLRPAPTAVGHG